MKPYLVIFSLIDEECFQDITNIVIAKNKKQAIELCDNLGRRFSPNWNVFAKRIKGNKPEVLHTCIE